MASALFWFLGKKYGHSFILWVGKYLGFNANDLLKAEKIFSKWVYWSVFFCQFIPLFRSVISIPSGILELKFKKFILATALGATIWSSALIIVAYNLGENWIKIEGILNAFSKPLFYGASVIFVTIGLFYVYKKYLKKIV